MWMVTVSGKKSGNKEIILESENEELNKFIVYLWQYKLTIISSLKRFQFLAIWILNFKYYEFSWSDFDTYFIFVSFLKLSKPHGTSVL